MSPNPLKEHAALAQLRAESSPPGWIYDCETLAFLEVNPAAIEFYGYSRTEFLSLTILDIRPIEEITPLLRTVFPSTRQASRIDQKSRHQKKNGTIFPAQVDSYDITFQQRATQLVLATPLAGAEFGPPQIHGLPLVSGSAFLLRLKHTFML
ncbi:MAG: PAS domain-containing protein [Terriglobales bacterium]